MHMTVQDKTGARDVRAETEAGAAEDAEDEWKKHLGDVV